MGASRQIEQRRSFQERQLDELNRENRVEEVECWKDLAKLNTERRMWLKQYGELLNWVRLFEGHPGYPVTAQHIRLNPRLMR